jgi:hypothetical protein
VLAAALEVRAGGLPARHQVAVSGLPGGPDICDFLSDRLGQPVVVALAVGAIRANAKPVLQVMSTRGETLCFAKVALTDLAKTLVAREAEVLTMLGGVGLRTLEVPRVLGLQAWNDSDVLLLSALPTSWRAPRGRSTPAMTQVREVAGVRELSTHRLGDGQELRRCLAVAAATTGPLASRLRSAVESLVAEHGGATLLHGCWHGDWGPWNMSRSGRAVSVWDWERFTEDVPLGLDAVHFLFQSRAATGTDHRRSARELVEDARGVNSAMGFPNKSPEALAATYAALIATRYLVDLGAPGGAVLGGHLERLVTVLESLVTDSPDALAGGPVRTGELQ